MGAIEQGRPSKQRLLSLLNDAFDGWGSEAYFEWRYDDYPDYDPESHTFFKIEKGELIAFRRLYRRDLQISNEEKPITAFMLGDTVVHEDHRGKGHYSELHARTTEYCEGQGVDLLLTYNNKANTTFAANRSRGWNYRDVPLYLYILSPGRVIKRYADRFIAPSETIGSVLSPIGDRIALHTSGETVRVSELVQENPGSTERRAIPVSLSDTAITDIVRSINNDEKREMVSTALKSLIDGEIRVANAEVAESEIFNDSALKSDMLETELKTVLSPAEIDAIRSLYEQRQEELTAWFLREPANIRHMTKYPNADVLVCREGDEIRGFAVIAPKRNEDIVEARILDIVYRRLGDFDHLLSEIIRVASEEGYDVLIGALERDPGSEWIPIDKQALMWRSLNPETDYAMLHHDDVKVSLYDV